MSEHFYLNECSFNQVARGIFNSTGLNMTEKRQSILRSEKTTKKNLCIVVLRFFRKVQRGRKDKKGKSILLLAVVINNPTRA